MSSYFAVSVQKGSESKVKELIERFIDFRAFKSITNIIVPVVNVLKFVGADTAQQKLKHFSGGYIYIEVNEESMRIPSSVYGFLKQVPGIRKILEYSISEEEIMQHCANVQTNELEAEIEIEMIHEEKENDMIQTIEKVNSAENLEDHKKAEEKLEEQIEQSFGKVKQLIDKGKEKGNKMIAACRAFIRRKKEVYRLPLALFLKTVERIDPKRQKPIRVLTDHNFIFPHLLETAREELVVHAET